MNVVPSLQYTQKTRFFFQAGEMALTSQAFQTIAAEGLSSQVRKVEAQQEQEQNQGESIFLSWQLKTVPRYKDVLLVPCMP